MTNLDKREQLAQAINGISAQLKGPMTDIERALLVADRRDMRKQLAALETPDTMASLGLSEWEVPGAKI